MIFSAAVLAGLLALLLHGVAQERASVHMVQHVLLGDLAPALALVALRGRLLFAVTPRFLRRRIVRRPLRTLLRPGPSLAAWASLLWIWHIPPVYDAALAHESLHVVEHTCFLVGGVLLWNQLVDPARRRALSLWGSLGYALAAMVVAQMLVALLVLSYRPLYAYDSAADQSLAGLVMAMEQFATLGAYAVVRLHTHFRAPLALGSGHPIRV